MGRTLMLEREDQTRDRAHATLLLMRLASDLAAVDDGPPPWKATPATFAEHLSAGRWQTADHLELLSRELAEIDHRPVRLIVSMPPRSGKSSLISHWFPTWLLDRHPDWRIMLASYEAGFAASWGRRVRNTVTEHGALLRVQVVDDSRAVERWETTAGGGMVTAGVGGALTGRGTECLIVDDFLKNAAEAMSAVQRNNLWEWWESTAYTRLEPGGSAIVLATRWHEDDLIGRLLDQMTRGGDQWRVIRLPAIAEGDDPLGREEGAALWPERYNEDALAQIKGSVSDWVWDALYQQRPSAPGGSIFSRAWWADGANRYDATDPTISRLAVARYISLDTAFKETDSAAYTACGLWELWPDYRLSVREVWRERLAFPDLIPAIERTAERFNYDGKLRNIIIEDRASGTSAYQTLRASSADWLARLLVAFSPSGSKAERAKQAAVWCRNGCILLPEPSAAVPWLHEYESELLAAPTGQFMDQVDMTSQTILFLEHLLADGWRARGMAAA